MDMQNPLRTENKTLLLSLGITKYVCREPVHLSLLPTRSILVLLSSWGPFYRHFTFRESTCLHKRSLSYTFTPTYEMRGRDIAKPTLLLPPVPPRASPHREGPGDKEQLFGNRFTGFQAAIINNQPAFTVFREESEK